MGFSLGDALTNQGMNQESARFVEACVTAGSAQDFKLVQMGFSQTLAIELARQINAGGGRADYLINLGMPFSQARVLSEAIGFLATTAPIVLFGDSLSEHNVQGFNAANSTEEASYSAREYLTWARIQNVGGKHLNWWDTTLPDKFVSGHNFGHAGDKLVQLYARKAPAINAAVGGIMILEVGTNNVDSNSASDNTFGYITTGAGAADSTRGLQGLIEDALAAGVKFVVVSTITPRPLSGSFSWASGSTKRIIFQQVNTWIRSYVSANPQRVKLFDYCAALSQGDADDTPIAGTINSDNIHPVPVGGYLGGVALKLALDKIIAPNVAPVIGTNYFPNPTFTGTGGTTATNVTGPIPDNLRISRPSGNVTPAVMSKGTLSSTRAEAPNGQPSYIITWTPSGTAVEEFDIDVLAGQIASASLPAIGSWMDAGVYVKVPASAGGVIGVDMRARQKPTNPANLSANANRSLTSPNYPLTSNAWEGWIRTTQFQLRTGMTSTDVFMLVILDSVAALAGGINTLSIEFCLPYIRQIADPTFVTT